MKVGFDLNNIKICEWCGRNDSQIRISMNRKANKYLCSKCAYQYKKYGTKVYTIYDEQQIDIINKEEAEIVLRDKNCNESGRAIIDFEDIQKCKKYKWHLGTNGYVYATINKNTHILLHRYLLNLTSKDNCDVDHINGNPLNNKKINLRIGTHQQNTYNGKISKNNSSNTTGVYYRKDRNKWAAYIHYNYKTYVIGQFDTKEEAIKERINTEINLYGEFSPYLSRIEKEEINETN